MIVPFVALLPVIAPDLARVVFAHGAAAEGGVDAYVPTLSLFGLGILFFTVPLPGAARLLRARAEPHRLLRPVPGRGHQHRGCGRPRRRDLGRAHVARARGRRTPRRTPWARSSPTCCCSHLLGGLRSRRLLVFGGRLAIATGLATGLTFPVAQVLDGLADDPGLVVAAVRLVAVGAVDVLLFLVFARLLRIEEVSQVVATLTRRSRA